MKYMIHRMYWKKNHEYFKKKEGKVGKIDPCKDL